MIWVKGRPKRKAEKDPQTILGIIGEKGISGAKGLAVAVIQHAVWDYVHGDVQKRNEVLRWLRKEDGAFEDYCAMAHLNPDYIRRLLKTNARMYRQGGGQRCHSSRPL